MAFTLPSLAYGYDALEPHIDAKTMEIHHTKHHQAYINKVNDAIAGTDLDGKTIEDLVSNLASVPADKLGAIRNNGGGHANHSLFWTVMGPGKGGSPSGDLAAALAQSGHSVHHASINRPAPAGGAANGVGAAVGALSSFDLSPLSLSDY